MFSAEPARSRCYQVMADLYSALAYKAQMTAETEVT